MLPAPVAASLVLRVISWVVALCSSTAAAMVAEMSLIWLMTPLIVPIASTGAFGVGLNGVILRLMSPWLWPSVWRVLHFIGHHGKAFAGVSGAGGFDGGVQGQ